MTERKRRVRDSVRTDKRKLGIFTHQICKDGSKGADLYTVGCMFDRVDNISKENGIITYCITNAV